MACVDPKSECKPRVPSDLRGHALFEAVGSLRDRDQVGGCRTTSPYSFAGGDRLSETFQQLPALQISRVFPSALLQRHCWVSAEKRLVPLAFVEGQVALKDTFYLLPQVERPSCP